MTPLKSLLDLWSSIAYTFPETKPMSAVTLSNHCKSKGYQALTIWLPQLGKLVDQSLSSEILPPLSKLVKNRKGTNLPVFLYEYFTLIYYDNGHMRPDVDPIVLRKLRTLLFMFYKYEFPFTDAQQLDAIVKFRNIDDSVKTQFTETHISLIKDTFNELLPRDPKDLRGRYSNGATACGYNGFDRRSLVRYIPSLMRVFGADYFFNTSKDLASYTSSHRITLCEPESKVAFVPKDSRGPRTICMEPHERMFIQQGLMHKMYEHIEKYSLHRGYVNFTDQTVNQRMAQKASLDGSWATLDLKDASDLVSNDLIMRLVSDEYREVLTALRTTTARLPDGTSKKLNKFAPMGSALCFPIEAALFYSICRTVAPIVYVYGDDIIVETKYAQQCIDMIEWYGLEVNVDKSLVRGYFRESCGLDAYKGAIITPIRYRKDDYTSVVAFANLVSSAFGISSGEAVITWYESFNPVIIPRIDHSAQHSNVFNGLYSNLILFKKKNDSCARSGYDFQRPVYRILDTTVKRKTVFNDDERAYFDWINQSDGYISPIEEQNYYVRPHKPTYFMCNVTTRFNLVREKLSWNWVAI